ncbi:MAG: hypothetical protein ABIH10_01770 [Spirochaetota bacterium]
MAKEAQPTQQFVDIKDIRGDVVTLKSGSLRRVLMVSGINFELKSEEEQNAVIYAYQNFLNTLDFSVQIVIRSRKMNIESYLDKLGERHSAEQNELLKNQISEYSEFIRSFIESNAVMAKNFFAIVPYDPMVIPGGGKKLLDIFGFGNKNKKSGIEENSEQKTTQLNQRTDQVINGLTQIGLRVVALTEEELMELFYNLYNPSTVEKK